MKLDRDCGPAVVAVKGVLCSVAFLLNMAHDHSVAVVWVSRDGTCSPLACVLNNTSMGCYVNMAQPNV